MTHSPTSRTILVTGGAGFIGSCFVRMAVAAGHRVVILDMLTYAGHKVNLEDIPREGYHLVVGDIANGALATELLQRHQVDSIVNFAAESHVDNSIRGPGAFIDTNIVGAYRLLEAAREYWGGLRAPAKNAFRFLQISTDEVYGSLGPTGSFNEESAVRPNSPYSASKAAADHLARAWFHTYGFPVIVTHCTNNYGPRQYPEKLIPVIIQRALSGKPIPVYGDGKNIRDWIFVEDHCAGILLALAKGTPGEVYDFGGRTELRNIDLAQKICALLDAKRPRADGKSYASHIAFVADRPGHDRRYAIDDGKAHKTLGYAPRHSFDRAIEHTVEWYLSNPAWSQQVMEKR